LNWLCTVPFEAVSTVNQLSETNPGFFHTALSLYQHGGIGVFYRGLPVSLLLAINPAIMNTLITTLLRLLVAIKEARGQDHFDARDHSASVVGCATGLAKVVATFLTYPLIRAKVLLQTRREKTTLMAVLRDEVSTEGVAGLYRGVIAMSYKTVLWNSLMMAVKHALGPKRAATPPGSPVVKSAAAERLARMPFLAREPFPVEMVTVEKLNEILSHLKMKDSASNQKRIDDLEAGLKGATQELREVKGLLKELVEASLQRTRINGQAPGRHVSFNEEED